MGFKTGRYYEHTDGSKLHIMAVVMSDMYVSPCYVAEDLKGNFIPVGISDNHAVNYHEISEADWKRELK